MATLTFAVGFVVRPFGALFFGRLGDLIGRKYTFMVTLLLMGGATFLIGCVPSYETIGFMAPVLVLILRMLQGLALGGEYGGAATYVEARPRRTKRILDFLDSNNSCRFIHFIDGDFGQETFLVQNNLTNGDGEFRSGSLLLW
jgi:nitrate/nitrite transporter NarK